MGKYYQAMQRLKVEPEAVAETSRAAEAENGRAPATRLLVPLAPPERIPPGVLNAPALRPISERIAPLAVLETTTRLLIAGCDHDDGASSVAAALAVDISQRLGLRTLLIDAHLRRPTLHLLFNAPAFRAHTTLSDGILQVRPTGLPHLDLTTCPTSPAEARQEGMVGEVERLAAGYQSVIVDLGVPRLDPRMVALARTTDPILLVVRYGYTRRVDLTTTVSALRAANRSIAGVILNDKSSPLCKSLRRFTTA